MLDYQNFRLQDFLKRGAESRNFTLFHISLRMKVIDYHIHVCVRSQCYI
jgi:hypothetical protein